MANGNGNGVLGFLKPSASTTFTGFGGAVAIVVIAILKQKNIDLGVEADVSLAVIFNTLAGYLPKSGRSRPPDARTRQTDIGANPS